MQHEITQVKIDKFEPKIQKADGEQAVSPDAVEKVDNPPKGGGGSYHWKFLPTEMHHRSGCGQHDCIYRSGTTGGAGI